LSTGMFVNCFGHYKIKNPDRKPVVLFHDKYIAWSQFPMVYVKAMGILQGVANL